MIKLNLKPRVLLPPPAPLHFTAAGDIPHNRRRHLVSLLISLPSVLCTLRFRVVLFLEGLRSVDVAWLAPIFSSELNSMGKKRKSLQSSQPPPERAPLQSNEFEYLPSRKRSRAPKHHHQVEPKWISSNLTAKILKEAINQLKEIEEEDKKKDSFYSIAENTSLAPEGEESDEDAFEGYSDSHSQYDGDIQEIDEEDEKILESFLSKNVGPQKTLTDVIIKRIKEKDAEVQLDIRPLPKLDSKVIELYKELGTY